eukprot:g37065.t1
MSVEHAGDVGAQYPTWRSFGASKPSKDMLCVHIEFSQWRICKVMEDAINSAIKQHPLSNNQLSDAQFGFCQGHSAPNLIDSNMDKRAEFQ